MGRMRHGVMALGVFVFAVCLGSAGYALDIYDNSSYTNSSPVNEDSISINGDSTATFENTVTVTNGIEIEAFGSSVANATFEDAVKAKYLTTNENTGNVTFEKTLTLDGYNNVDNPPPGVNVPTTYALGLGGGTNTFADVTTTDATNGHIVVAGGETTFNGAVTSAARIWVGGYPGGADATVILGDGASLSATNGGVEIANKGILKLAGSATVDGGLTARGGAITSASGTTLTVNNGMLRILSGATGTFDGKVVVDDAGIQFDTYDSTAPSATFKDTVEANYLTTNENSGNITFEKTLTLDGYNTVDNHPGGNAPTTYALGIGGGGTNTFADVTTTDAANGHIGISGGQATFTGAVTSAARIWVGGYPDGVDATVILGDGASLSATNGGVEIANKGILQAGSGNTVTGNLNFKSGSTFAIDAKNTLTVSGATDIEDGAMANVQNIDSIDAVGKTILASNSVTGAFGANGLYQVETSGNTVKIAGMNRVEDVLSTNNITTGNSASAAAMTTAVMNDASASAALRTNLNNAVQNIVTLAASNPELAKAAAAQLFGEHGLAGISASQTTAQNFSGSVGNHQIQLRDAEMAAASVGSSSALASFGSGVSGFNPNRIWGGGFGAWTDQDDRNNMTGYEYRSGGFILGYDRKIGSSLTVGFSGAYSTGEVENNDGYTTTDIDTFNVGVYASYNHCSGFFADVNAGFGFAWNDTETEDIINGGRKTGDYNNTSFQLGTTVGYAFNLPQGFRFIPSVGVQYTRVNQDAWSEKVNANQIANAFDESNQNYVSIPVQVRINKTFELGNGASITPEVRGAWIYEAKDPQARVRMSYVGSTASTTLSGIDAGRSRGLVGAGVKMKFSECVDAFVDYNYEFRSGYSNHNVMAGLGLSF